MQNSYIVIIETGDRYLPVMITPYQARSIHLGLSEKEFERPSKHDLILNIINEIGGTLDLIVIDDLIENVFHAQLHIESYIEKERKEHIIDARSSDAIALAVRNQCPIEVKEDIVEKAGVKKDQIEFRDF